MPRTLQSKLVAFVVGLIASAVLLLGVLFYQQLRGQLLEGIENEIRSAATAYSLAIGEWMAPKVQLLKAIKPVIGTSEAKSVFVLAKAAGGFDTVYAGYPDKRALFSESQNLPADWDPTSRPWYKEAELAGEAQIVITKPYADAGTKKLVISISSLVKDGGGTVGVAAADLFIDRIVSEVLALKLAGNGFGFLLHKDGTVLAHPLKEAVMKPVTEQVPELSSDRIGRAASEGKMFAVQRNDGDRLLFLAPIKGTDWLLGISLEKNVLLAPLNRLLMTMLLVLVAVGGMAALIAGGVVRRMLKGLHQVRNRMVEISHGGGDLSVRLDVVGDDEIGQTATAFNAFLTQLQSMFSSLRSEAAELATGVHRLNGNVDQLAHASINLSRSSSANAASIEQITVAVSHIADNADDADKLLRETGELSAASSSAVDAVATDAQTSVGQVEELARVMSSLDGRSQEISTIVNVIKSIADQTNLLALNAAIEAARAGEQGRGFAVVADEVRKLAESTAKATIEIANMISVVRDETGQAGTTVNSTVDTVKRGVQMSRVAVSRINDIQQKMNDAIARVGDIALATREQRAAMTAMAQSSERINQGVQSEDAAIQEARVTISSLSNNAKNTQRLLEDFRG